MDRERLNVGGITPDWLASWQRAVDLFTEVLGARAGAVMEIEESDLTVRVASANPDCPFESGPAGPMAGTYCEEVINTRRRLHVLDARKDPKWDDRPEIERALISYLGYPILNPDGTVFGTLCVFDDTPNEFGDRLDELMGEFKGLIESHLAMMRLNRDLDAQNEILERQMEEIRTLRDLIPICAWCKNVRDDEGYWHGFERYITMLSGGDVTHGICPDCLSAQSAAVAGDDRDPRPEILVG